MYSNVQNEMFDGLLRSCFSEFITEEAAKMPSDTEIAKMYPAPKKVPRKYLRLAKAKKYNMPIALVYLKRVAVVCLIILSVTFGALLTVEGIREEIADTVITWFKKYAEFDYSNSDVPAPTKENTSVTDESGDPEIDDSDIFAAIGALTIGYIPEGFELTDSTEDSFMREYLYFAENGDYLLVGIYDSRYSDTGVDNEDVEYETLMIGGSETHLFYDSAEKIGTIITGNKLFHIAITGICEKEDLIKIMENIK